MRSLVLVGHGSHHSGEAAQVVYRHSEMLRGQGLFAEVTETFWKEEPSLRQVLRTTISTDVTVVPMFLQPGYLTETVLPQELGLGHQGPVPPGGVARVIGGRTVRYTQPYGMHPAMQQVIVACVHEALGQTGESSDHRQNQSVAVVLLGQEPPGRTSTQVALAQQEVLAQQEALAQHAAALNQTRQFAGVQVAYLGQYPEPQHLEVQAAQVVVVPFWPTEVPQLQERFQAQYLLDYQRSQSAVELTFAQAVGTHPAVSMVIAQVAQEARSDAPGGDVDQTHQESWALFLRLAYGGLRLGETLITPHAGLFELRHMLDEGRPTTELVTYATPEGLLERVRFDDAGRFRPVRTFRTLPRGWRAVLTEADLPRAVHHLYPAVVEEARAYSLHNLRRTPWPTTARRQTGLYARVQQATTTQIEQVATQVCSSCLRCRLWAGEPLTLTFFDGVPGGLPCAEACTYFVSRLRDILIAGPQQEP